MIAGGAITSAVQTVASRSAARFSAMTWKPTLGSFDFRNDPAA